jgi:glutathione S-transferase
MCGASEMTPLTLVSFELCPYVQRAAIVLAEKEVPFERINVDLANKPEWFKAISPTGKVPLLRVGEEVLFESSVIVEYLEETQPKPMHPQAPLSKARHRSWMEFGSAILADIWTLETTPDEKTFHAKAKLLKEKFAKLEKALTAGPYFGGKKFSIVDAAFAPVFRYFDVFDRILDLGVFDGLPKVQAWRKALAARPSVANAVVPNFKDLLRSFLLRKQGYIATRMT